MISRKTYIGASASVVALALASGGAFANEDVLRLQEDPSIVVMPSITYNGWNY